MCDILCQLMDKLALAAGFFYVAILQFIRTTVGQSDVYGISEIAYSAIKAWM